MQWNVMAPELTVFDFAKSLRFYTDTLGFEIVYQREQPDFAYLNLQGVQIMLEAYHAEGWNVGELTPPLGRGVNLQIELPDIQPLYARLLASGWPFYRPPVENWYDTGAALSGQREFLIQDPDGYLLRFCQFLGERDKVESGS